MYNKNRKQPYFTRGNTLIDIRDNYADDCAYINEENKYCPLHRRRCKGECQDYRTIKNYHIIYKTTSNNSNKNQENFIVNLVDKIVIKNDTGEKYKIVQQDSNIIKFGNYSFDYIEALSSGVITLEDKEILSEILLKIIKEFKGKNK